MSLSSEVRIGPCEDRTLIHNEPGSSRRPRRSLIWFCVLRMGLTMGLSMVAPIIASSQTQTDPNPPGRGPEFRIQFMPRGLMYRSYLAGEKEPRIGAQWLHGNVGWIWEASFGGRLPLWRYGTDDPLRPEGLQMDVEGATFTRVDVGTGTEVDAIDFRVGFLVTWRRGRTALKGGSYHISSHIGDEYLVRNPNFVRNDYTRESLIGGITQDLTDALSVYGEVGYAFRYQGGAEPFELQFGIQYNPQPREGWWGRPYAAINAHLRQEFDFARNINTVAGIQWRSRESLRVIRIGLQYFNGQSLQYSFFDQHEEWLGTGVWVDF